MNNSEFITAVEAVEALVAQREADIAAAPAKEREAAAWTPRITADECKAMQQNIKAALNDEAKQICDKCVEFINAVKPMIEAYNADIKRGNHALFALPLWLLCDPDVMDHAKWYESENDPRFTASGLENTRMFALYSASNPAYRRVLDIVTSRGNQLFEGI